MVHPGEVSQSSADRRRNPYTAGKPVETPLMFFGREAEQQALFERITNGIHTAVVGPPAIGVSSLLRQLAAGLKGTGYLVAYADLTSGEAHRPSRLTQLLWSQWWRQIRAGYVPGINSMRVFDRLARQLTRAGHKLVAILDGYEQILWRPAQFDVEFQNQLETLVQEGIFTLVTGSHEPLAELYQQAGSTSGLYTHLVQQDLGLLTVPAARQLLMTPLGRARFELPAADVEHFVNLAGTHPLFLQVVGTYVYTAFESNRYDRGQVDARFRAAAEPHWQEVWQALPPPARAGLSSKAAGSGATIDSRLARNLRRKGLVRDDGGAVRLYSQGFAEWVARMQAAAQSARAVSGVE